MVRIKKESTKYNKLYWIRMKNNPEMYRKRKESNKRWRDKNKEQINIKAVEYRKNNLEEVRKKNREYGRLKEYEKARGYHKKWYQKNKEAVRVKSKETYDKNIMNPVWKQKELLRCRLKYKKFKEKYKESRKKYYKTQNGRMNMRKHVWDRRAREKEVVHLFTKEQWIDKLKKTKGICKSCMKNVGENNLTLDHINPLSKAKKEEIYTIDDIDAICKSCNSKKSNKLIV